MTAPGQLDNGRKRPACLVSPH